MSKQRVLVTYTAQSSFLSSDNWKKVHAALLEQLPLRSLHWKSASRPSLRTIQELDVALIPLDLVREEHSQVPVTLLEKPLLNIYIVVCEDLDSYRTTVKKQLRDWVTSVTQRRNQEWLILHLVHPDARTSGGGFFAMKGSVFDKMKAEFTVEKRDRCVQLIWSTTNDNPAAWADLITKIKDGLLSAFNSSVSQREEEVKRSESQRQMPGWNFCTFFILKESLASSFEGVNLFEDALLQYDELEASFFQVLREKNLSWFGTLIAPTGKDDSQPLLSITKKPYRDLILANTISVFDFRIYLLAKQCILLAKLGRIIEVGTKVTAFLGAFGRRLREVEAILPSYFIESWIYASSLSVVEQCDSWVADHKFDSTRMARFNAVKGELLELARNQLDTLGIRVGYLPCRPPFSMSFPNPPPSDDNATHERQSQKISQSDILSSLQDKDVFYDLFVSVTNRAIDLYAKSGRRKFALKLHGSLAALDVHRGRSSSALTTYRSLPAHYAPHTWTSLESYMLSQAIDTYAGLDEKRDREWIHIVLSFLKTYVEGLGNEMLMLHEDKVAYVTNLVEAMKDAAKALDTDLPYPDSSIISVLVHETATITGTEDGSSLDILVENRLPCDLPIDEISVILAGRDSERLKFRGKASSLAPGRTTLTVLCPTPSSGTYLVELNEIRISGLLLQWTARKPPKSSRVQRRRHAVVRIPKDIRALDVLLRQPRKVVLSSSSKLVVSVSTGRNHITRAILRLYGPSGVQFKYAEVTLLDCNEPYIESSDDCISLSNIPNDRTVDILIPHSDVSTFHAMKVRVNVDYDTASEPGKTRTVQLARIVTTSLPIAVNVQDFFRDHSLFSKFSISTTSHQHVRILSAELIDPSQDPQGVRITGSRLQRHGILTVTPAQPANFLFRIDSSSDPIREPLRLLIRYRMLREEVESAILQRVDTVVKNSRSLLRERDVIVSKFIQALENNASWVELYDITGELKVPGLESEEGEIGEAVQHVKEALLNGGHSEEVRCHWREISIPVDIPNMNIVAAARIRIVSTSSSGETLSGKLPPLYSGQPISAILTISTSLHWGATSGNDKQMYMMRFDVEEMVREWLVSGQKRGGFVATDGGVFSVPITLIALRHGKLSLPKVAVMSLPLIGETIGGPTAVPSTETYQVHGAEKVLVLPRGGRSTFVLGMGGDTHL